TIFAAASSMAATLPLLSRLREASGDALTSFEMIPRVALELAMAHVPGSFDPFAKPHDPYLLIELSAGSASLDLRAMVEPVPADAPIAESEARAGRLWFLREAVFEAQPPAGASIKHDVAVPVAAVAAFLAEAKPALESALPGVTVYAFGHLGDGNIHFNLIQP